MLALALVHGPAAALADETAATSASIPAVTAAADRAAVSVTTVPLATVLVPAQRDVPATVIAIDAPALGAEISARIESIAVRVGDRVQSGDPLVRLDCRVYQSRLAAAQASLAELEARRRFAQSQLDRALDLKRKDSISDEIVDQRRSELDSLSATMDVQRQTLVQAGLDVERCTVRAPFAGVVTERLADTGGLASPGTLLLRLVSTGRIELSARLREGDIAGLLQATALRFTHAGTDHAVEVRRVLPVVDERLRTREVRLAFRAEAAPTHPPVHPPAGAAGRLVWHDGQWRLPAQYLVRREGQLGLFHAEGARARFHPLPRAIEGQAAVVDLSGDTALIVDGRQRLRPGEAVVVVAED